MAVDDDDLLGDGSSRGPGDPGKPNSRDPDMADDANFDGGPDILNATAQGRLRTFIERLERLEEDKQAVMTDMKEVFAELKGEGYDSVVIRAVLKRRKQDKAKVQEFEAIFDLYLSALGDI